MKEYSLAILPGDGIGPEVITEAVKVLEATAKHYDFTLQLEYANIGGAAYDETGQPLPEKTLAIAKAADAVLLGAVGGPQYDTLDRPLRPERALLGIRKEMGLFSNLRPAITFPSLQKVSSIKEEVIDNLDLLIVRELTGGIYFGEPRGIEERNGERVGFNTLVYSESEIKRIATSAFEAARVRNKKLCSVDKANVLEVSELWREVVHEVAKEYPDIEVTDMYVDNAAMQLVRNPKQFDVMVTSNMFGDILSDIASMLTGSIGMLPSASLNEKRQGLYEPVHGSAPDIAGKGLANPMATILSAAMLLRYSLNETKAAKAIEDAVMQCLDSGIGTADVMQAGQKTSSTSEVGDAIAAKIQ